MPTAYCGSQLVERRIEASLCAQSSRSLERPRLKGVCELGIRFGPIAAGRIRFRPTLRDDPRGVLLVVECDDAVVPTDGQCGKSELVDLRPGNAFEAARQFVAEHPGQSALKRRQVGPQVAASCETTSANSASESGEFHQRIGSAATNEYRPVGPPRTALSRNTACGNCASRRKASTASMVGSSRSTSVMGGRGSCRA